MNPALLIEGPGEYVDPFALADFYQSAVYEWDIRELPACWRGTFQTELQGEASPATPPPVRGEYSTGSSFPARHGAGRAMSAGACPSPRARQERVTRWLVSERAQRITAGCAVAIALLLIGLVAK